MAVLLSFSLSLSLPPSVPLLWLWVNWVENMNENITPADLTGFAVGINTVWWGVGEWGWVGGRCRSVSFLTVYRGTIWRRSVRGRGKANSVTHWKPCAPFCGWVSVYLGFGDSGGGFCVSGLLKMKKYWLCVSSILCVCERDRVFECVRQRERDKESILE